MLRTRNKYCSNCLSTQRFLDLGASLVCERCSKRLDVVSPEVNQQPPGGGRIVPWAERWDRPAAHRDGGRREAM